MSEQRDQGDETPEYERGQTQNWSPEVAHENPCLHRATVPLAGGLRLCLSCSTVGGDGE